MRSKIKDRETSLQKRITNVQMLRTVGIFTQLANLIHFVISRAGPSSRGLKQPISKKRWTGEQLQVKARSINNIVTSGGMYSKLNYNKETTSVGVLCLTFSIVFTINKREKYSVFKICSAIYLPTTILTLSAVARWTLQIWCWSQKTWKK